MTYNGGTETRVYNSMLQLTTITGVSQNVTYQNITYTFPAAGSNAGKITSQTDSISGETVAYAYDSLNRLTSASATSNAWSQTYSYDGFGNLTNRTGYGTAQSTTISTPASAATNQLSGYAYDLNGNQISTGYAYDAENRLVQANAGAIHYAYDSQNKRIWQATFSNCGGDSCMSSDSISLFGIDGKMIGTYTAGAAWNNTQTQIQLSFYSTTQRVYFGPKLVATLDWQGSQHGVVQDRLSSVGKYYSFGEERNSPPLANDYVKFATYTRDSATGLDYADQRFYASTFGRFTSPDPYQASGGPSDPGSWNRYAYTQGDPINGNDPGGLNVSSNFNETWEVGCFIADMPWIGGPCRPGGEGGGGGGDPCANGSAFAPGQVPTAFCYAPIMVFVPPPDPECSIEVYDRPIEETLGADIPGARHGYIRFIDQFGGQTVFEGIHSGNSVTASTGPFVTDALKADKPFKHNNHFDGDITGPEICDWLGILQNDVATVNGAPTIHYNPFGTNSSSVLRYMLQSLPNQAWYGMPWMIGYGSLLPGIETP